LHPGGLALQTYIIGLGGSYRGEALEAELSKWSIGFERSDGVADVFQGKPSSDFVDQVTAKVIHGSELIRGEIGCALAHLVVYQSLLKSDEKWAFVLEDDAEILDGQALIQSLKYIQALETHLPSIYMAHAAGLVSTGVHLQIFHDYEAWELLITPGLCTGYFINRSAAAKLLSASIPLISPADWPIRAEGEIKFSAIYPWLVSPSSSVASLIGPRNQVDNRRFREGDKSRISSALSWIPRLSSVPVRYLRIFWVSNVLRFLTRSLMGPDWTYTLPKDSAFPVAPKLIRVLYKFFSLSFLNGQDSRSAKKQTQAIPAETWNWSQKNL
jgi:glycosyl transferase family 25